MVLSTLIQKKFRSSRIRGMGLSIKIISQSFINPLWPYISGMTCILNTANLTWKKVNRAFAITVKGGVYLINFFSHKTLKYVSLFYVAGSFTSAFSTTKCTFFPKKWVHFSSNQMVSQTVTRNKWNKWHTKM